MFPALLPGLRCEVKIGLVCACQIIQGSSGTEFQCCRETYRLHGPCLVLVWRKGDTEVNSKEVSVPIQKRAKEMQTWSCCHLSCCNSVHTSVYSLGWSDQGQRHLRGLCKPYSSGLSPKHLSDLHVDCCYALVIFVSNWGMLACINLGGFNPLDDSPTVQYQGCN